MTPPVHHINTIIIMVLTGSTVVLVVEKQCGCWGGGGGTGAYTRSKEFNSNAKDAPARVNNQIPDRFEGRNSSFIVDAQVIERGRFARCEFICLLGTRKHFHHSYNLYPLKSGFDHIICTKLLPG